MRIAVDQDEVLCQWGKKIVEWYNEDKAKEASVEGKTWTPLTHEQIDNWSIQMNLGPGSEIYMRNYMRYPNFYQSLEPIPGAIEGMKALLEMGHDVIIATAVPKCAGLAYEGKMEWIREHMPFFPIDNLVSIKRKDILAPWADMLLDDGVHNLDPWHDSGKLAVAYDHPWNKKAKTPFRVHSWPDFVDFVETYDRGPVTGLLQWYENR